LATNARPAAPASANVQCVANEKRKTSMKLSIRQMYTILAGLQLIRHSLENSKGEETPAGMLTAAEITRLINDLQVLHPMPLEPGVVPDPEIVRCAVILNEDGFEMEAGPLCNRVEWHKLLAALGISLTTPMRDIKEKVRDQLSIDPQAYD
jgi:hypothetical protein